MQRRAGLLVVGARACLLFPASLLLTQQIVRDDCNSVAIIQLDVAAAVAQTCDFSTIENESHRASHHQLSYQACLEKKLCNESGFELVVVQLDINGYARRNHGVEDGSIMRLLHVLAELHTDPVLGAAIEAIYKTGVMLCMPRECAVKERSLLSQVVTQLVWNLSVRLPPPAPPELRLLQIKESTTPNLVKRGSLGQGFNLPWWLNCKKMPGWHRWALLAHETLRSRVPSRKGIWEARRVLKHHAWLASVWIGEAEKYAVYNSFHTVPPQWERADDVDPEISLVSFAMVPGDDARWHLPLWKLWLGFCSMGYTAALVVRARYFVQKGRNLAAQWDLSRAQAMIGGHCGMMDFLDRRIWGVNAEDISSDLKNVNAKIWCSSRSACYRDIIRSDRTHKRSADALQLQWHALQLNTLVRVRLQDSADQQTAHANIGKLALLAFPSYLSLFIVPMFEYIWGLDLDLVILHIGPWDLHNEKCADCMKRYAKNFVIDDWALQAIPYNSSENYLTGSGSITWSLGFGLKEFLSHLHVSLIMNAPAKDANLILCTSAAWVCAGVAALETRPVLVLDLLEPTLHAPESIMADTDVVFAQLDGIALGLKEWANRNVPMEYLRTLWVREEPIRSYGTPELGPSSSSRVPSVARGFFCPFVALPAMHISDRYDCGTASPMVLVMREGSSSWAGKFERTIRGKLFFAALSQITSASSPWWFRILPYNEERLSYAELARHHAAVWMPMVHHSKQTFNDLVAMCLPLFMPTAALQMEISKLYFCTLQMKGNAPSWILDQCKWEEIGRRLPLAKFFRHPFVQRFNSFSDLVIQLTLTRCDRLNILSARMSNWNRMQIDDDVVFWRAAIQALTAVQVRATTAQIGKMIASRGELTGSNPADLALPELRSPHVPQSQCDSAPNAVHCQLSGRGQEWINRCCENTQQLEEQLPGGQLLADVSGIPESQHCLWHPAACSQEVLRHGTHLLHKRIVFDELLSNPHPIKHFAMNDASSDRPV